MTKKLKIAIYSGDIPSTTFIERLIKGLSVKHDIYLFGFLKERIRYNSNISVIGYKNTRIYKLLHFLKYGLLLFFFKNKEKKTLDAILKMSSKNVLLSKVKCYPVLWHQPDVFHVQWAKGLNDWMWVQEFGIKLVLSLRGAHINYSPIADNKLASMYKENFIKVDGFHAVSKAIALESLKYGALKEKIQVVYSGLDLDNMKNEKSSPNLVFKMVSIGRPHWKKGYTYAIDACKILKEKKISFKYYIVGGLSNLELVYQIKELDLEDEVILIDKLPFNEVQTFIQSSDLLVLPSVEEGIANVVLEAMALETLVLTTNCGGMKEVIINEVNGFLVPIRNSEAMAEHIIKAIKMPEEEKREIIKRASLKVKGQHNSGKMVDDMLNLYNSLNIEK